MTPGRDDIENGADLLAEAVTRACTFDFDGAEALCRRIVAPEDQKARAQSLLRAIDHNRSSYLYRLARQRTASGAAAPAWRWLLRRVRGAAGRFEVKFDEDAMTVAGTVLDSSPMVHVFVNELLITCLPTEHGYTSLRGARTFTFRIKRDSLSLFPREPPARLAISTGRHMLHHVAGGLAYGCDWPDGRGGIEEAVLNGAMLTSHYRIKAAPDAGTTARWLDAYERLAAFMREDRGQPLFLYYGSLLGAVRDRRIIPYDDDFDVAWFSGGATPHQVKEEMISLIAGLAAREPRTLIRLNKFFFKVRMEGINIDVFPTWHDGRFLWSPLVTRLECDRGLLADVVESEFHGRRVLVPARAEEFLELKYGKGWRTPDPGFRAERLADDAYPFRSMLFGAEDRARIIAAAREIAGGKAIAAVKLVGE